MEQRDAESGTEFVLDNRKLIIGFVLLMVVCGAFYTVGFMEGKRQAVQPRVERMSPGPVPSVAEVTVGSDSKANAAAAKTASVGDRSVREQLDWYKNVQSSGGEPRRPGDAAKSVKTAPAPVNPASALQPQVAKAVAASAQGSITPPPKVTYTVQVGAFRQRLDAEAKAAGIKAKGYPCEVELSQSADQIYLVVVGKFDSRADAVAMLRKLQQDGFSSFVRGK
jgi:cell division septation protein DedD